MNRNQKPKRRVHLGLLATAAVLAAMMVPAASASAASPLWQTGPIPAKMSQLTGSEAVTASLPESLHVHTLLFKENIDIVATGIECVGCKIENTGSGATAAATGTGTIKLTGATIPSKPGCEVGTVLSSGAEVPGIQFQPLKWKVESPSAVAFSTVSGGAIWSARITGGSCSVAGKFNLNGKPVGVPTSTLSVPALTRKFQFTGGWPSEGSLALEGTVSQALSSGLYWSAK